MAETNTAPPDGYKTTELGPLPEEWEVVRLQNAIGNIVSGDWGAAEQIGGLVAVGAIRGTDFARAARGSLESVPIRYLKENSIQKRQVRPGDALVELSGGSKDQPTGRLLLVPQNLLQASERPIVFSNFVKRLRVDDLLSKPAM